MTLMATLENIKQGNTCEPAVEELIKYFEANNLTEISFEEVIAHWKSIDHRDWAVWAYQNKEVFEQIANYTSTPEEIVQDNAELNALEVLNFTNTYSLNGVIYQTLDEVTAANAILQADLLAQATKTTICNLEIFNSNDTTTWSVIDLATFVPDPNVKWAIQIFDHETGLYTKATTLEEAKSVQATLVQKECNRICSNQLKIARVMVNPEFPNDKVLNYDIQL